MHNSPSLKVSIIYVIMFACAMGFFKWGEKLNSRTNALEQRTKHMEEVLGGPYYNYPKINWG